MEGDRQPLPWRGDHAQRVGDVGLLLHPDQGQFRGGLALGAVFNREHVLEQRVARADLAPLLDQQQWAVLVLLDLGVLALQKLHPLGPAHRSGNPDAKWKRVDEEAHHLPDSGEITGAARDRHPQNHVPGPGVPVQEKCPAALDHGLERKVVLLACRPQAGRLLLVEQEADLVVADQIRPGVRFPAGTDPALHRERRGRGNRIQLVTPVELGFVDVLAAQPLDVLPVCRCRADIQRTLGRQVAVVRLDFTEHDLLAPSVKDDVMETPDNLVARLAQPGDMESPERRLLQRKAPGMILPTVRLQPAALLFGAQPAPVLDDQGNVQPLVYRLQRIPALEVAEARSQRGVPLHDMPPTLAECLDLEILLDSEHHLYVEEPGPPSKAALKHDALLGGSHRVAGFDGFFTQERLGTRCRRASTCIHWSRPLASADGSRLVGGWQRPGFRRPPLTAGRRYGRRAPRSCRRVPGRNGRTSRSAGRSDAAGPDLG